MATNTHNLFFLNYTRFKHIKIVIIIIFFTSLIQKTTSISAKANILHFAHTSTINALHQSKNIAQRSCHSSTQLQHSSQNNTTTTTQNNNSNIAVQNAVIVLINMNITCNYYISFVIKCTAEDLICMSFKYLREGKKKPLKTRVVKGAHLGVNPGF